MCERGRPCPRVQRAVLVLQGAFCNVQGWGSHICLRSKKNLAMHHQERMWGERSRRTLEYTTG